MGALGAGSPNAAVASWGGGLTMFSQILCWGALVIGISQLGLTLTARTRARLHSGRDGALFLTAGTMAILAYLDSGPRSTYLALNFPLLLTAASGILTMFIAGVRERSMTRRLEVPGTESTTLWESVGRALTDSPSLDRMLLGVAASLREATRATSAVVFKLARHGTEPILVGRSAEVFTPEHEKVATGDLASLAAHAATDPRVAEYHHSGARPDPYAGSGNWGLIPVAAGNDALGAILLEDPQVPLTSPPTSKTLAGVGQLTGRAVKDWVKTAAGNVSESLMDRLPALAAALATQTRFERGIIPVSDALQGVVDAEYISITWMDRAQSHEDRAAMIVGDSQIRDNRRRWPIWDGPTALVLKADRPHITPDLNEIDLQDYGDSIPVERRLGYRTRMIVPVRDTDGLIGSMTIAHREPAHYGEDDAIVMRAVAGVYGAWLRRLEERRRVEQYSRTIRLATQLEDNPGVWASDRALLEAVLPSINTTGLTLWRLDPAEQRLTQAAQIGRRDDLAGDSNTNGDKPELTQAPWHRWAMTEKAPRYVDQSDPELLMSQIEAGMTMGVRVKTGWIVPICWGEQTLGFLDATETRSPDRHHLGETERFLLSVVARALARRWMETAPQSAPFDWHYRMSNLNGALINPITGIYGAVELIRHRQENLTPDSMKYLNMVEQSARRIHEAVTVALGDLTMQSRTQADPNQKEAVLIERPRLALGSTPETAAPMERVRLSTHNRFATVPVGSIEMPG